MRLLICTQALDKNHPILGFFHRWVLEFSKHCEVVHVIALEVGEYDLPPNVRVHSLGKERGKNRLRELFRFYRYAFGLRCEYDAVFVHMNQIYVILGAPFWRVVGKRVGLWYMHGTVSPSLRLAERLAHVIFSGSRESFRLPSSKLVVTGHGIDADHFYPRAVSKQYNLITVGRLSRTKQLEVQLRSLVEIRKVAPAVTLTIAGRAVTEDDHRYEEELLKLIDELFLKDAVVWLGAVSQAELPEVLSSARVFVHSAQNGSLDKVLLEAMATGLRVVSCGTGAASLPLGEDYVTTVGAFSARLREVVQSSDPAPVSYRSYVAEQHSLAGLIPKILASYGVSKTGR